ncbi:MAG: primosomal protein N' [Anaerolineales bacterium]|nr:primosomal protein N' [Anaerolineales bacterium]
MKFVEIAVSIPRVTGVFHYHLLPEMEDTLQPGSLVVVPFGENLVRGVVLRFVPSPEVPETKPVAALIDARITLPTRQIQLAETLADKNFSSVAAFMGLMIPPGLNPSANVRYSLAADAPQRSLNSLQQKIVDYIREKGAQSASKLENHFPHSSWKQAVKQLLDQGFLRAEPFINPPSIRPKMIRTARLAISPEKVSQAVADFSNSWRGTHERREKVLQFLAEDGGWVDVTWIYAHSGTNIADLKKLQELDLIILSEQEAWRDPLAGIAYDPSTPLTLTADQQKVWEKLQPALENAAERKPSQPFLLHGVTGSGKTEIYLHAVAWCISRGKQAYILVPEIAMTPQTIRRFMARFPGQVGLVHSQLSQGERYDTWRRARQGLLSVIVGSRSALFCPLPDPALIVLDEEHDASYYQDDFLPFYDAREAALELSHLTSAVSLFASATPSITSFQKAQTGQWDLLELPGRILAHRKTVEIYESKYGHTEIYHGEAGQVSSAHLPPVHIVDMRKELKENHTSIFSRPLLVELEKTLTAKQQAILFLNRRGTASYVFCRACGFTLKCPNDDIPLTYHHDQHLLVCHHCNHHEPLPNACPDCGDPRIRQFGLGTQQVEQEVRSLFPDARTLRLDWDSTRGKGDHDMIYSHFVNHHADILVGTQMLAKGLDLPLVTLVGVVLADVGLHLPDYNAGERVFQVLAQVAGRAGRSPLGGRVILQTFEPANYVIQTASRHDFNAFFQEEIRLRQKINYPPFSHLARLETRAPESLQAEKRANILADRIQQILLQYPGKWQLIGPAPGFYEKVNNQYRWQIILKGQDPLPLLILLGSLPDWHIEVNPQSLL